VAQKNITGSTFSQGIFNNGTIQSDVTVRADIYLSRVQTAAASFTLNQCNNYWADALALGAGSAITSMMGFNADHTLNKATNNYGFYSNLASATNSWNFYANGTAANYFAGQTTVGSTSLALGSGSVAQQFGVVAGAATTVGLVIRGAASATADLQQWQNSAGTVLAKVGSDGVLRGNGTFLAGAAGSTAPQFDANGNFTAQQIGSNQSMVARQIIASQVPMTVRGAASQSANLLELQTSASAVLTSITAAGTINFQSGNTSATANTGAVALPALAVGFITMQVAGTTVKVPYYAN